MSAIRNADGIFVNTNALREEALHFEKYGYYCADPIGSPSYIDYWKEQARRCIHGYTSGGVEITGAHYKYLNFNQIKLTKDSHEKVTKSATKVVTFPSFWDGDYDYFWNLQIARHGITEDKLSRLNLTNIPNDISGGKYICIGKARRKGFSYKNASLVNHAYTFIPNSVSIIGAFAKDYLYPDGTMKMVSDYMNFINANTAWGKKREYVDKINHKKASYKYVDPLTGLDIEKGFMSQVYAVTFKDNPDAARGKDGTLILLEEAGKFPNLIDAWKAIDPAFRDGTFVTGMIVIFGTGSGAKGKENDWEGFSEIYYNPEQYNMISYDNVFDEEFEGEKCSYFFPDNQNLPGYMDADGNSDLEGAKQFRLREREHLIAKSGTGSSAANGHLQEYAHKPSEAFLVSNNNDFNIAAIRTQWNKLKFSESHKNIAKIIQPYRNSDGTVDYKIIFNNKHPVLDSWKPKVTDLTGCIVMYEPPIKDAPLGTYIAGYDPKRQNSTASSESTHATYIEKGHNDFSYTGGYIVAEYVGAPSEPNTYFENQLLLLDLYNADMMHENEVVEVRTWYRRKKRLDRLLAQPDAVISANIKESGVQRIYGTHMTVQLKIAGLKYINDHLNETIAGLNSDNEQISVSQITRIYSKGLLEELLKYDFEKDQKKKANYDRIMAYMMIRIYRQNEELDYVHSKKNINKTAQKILSSSRTQFRNVNPRNNAI